MFNYLRTRNTDDTSGFCVLSSIPYIENLKTFMRESRGGGGTGGPVTT